MGLSLTAVYCGDEYVVARVQQDPNHRSSRTESACLAPDNTETMYHVRIRLIQPWKVGQPPVPLRGGGRLAERRWPLDPLFTTLLIGDGLVERVQQYPSFRFSSTASASLASDHDERFVPGEVHETP